MARHYLTSGLLTVALCAGACGGSVPTASSAIPPQVAVTILPSTGLPLVVAGQSNAVILAPVLAARYTPVVVSASSGRPIAVWSPIPAPPFAFHPEYLDLKAQLEAQRPFRAFVWWQGESDRTHPDYAGALRELMGRVRSYSQQPDLPIILVRVLDMPSNASVRAAQEAFVASDSHAILISSDGFRDGESDHLTVLGYEAIAARIVGALR